MNGKFKLMIGCVFLARAFVAGSDAAYKRGFLLKSI